MSEVKEKIDKFEYIIGDLEIIPLYFNRSSLTTHTRIVSYRYTHRGNKVTLIYLVLGHNAYKHRILYLH